MTGAESTLLDRFMSAVDRVTGLEYRPTDDKLLRLYGLYKQVYSGDCDAPRPEAWKARERRKWEAWTKNRGKDQSVAMEEYISLVESLTRGDQ